MRGTTGKCPGCDGTGEVASPCEERGCNKRGLHFISNAHWEQAHRGVAEQPDPVIGQMVGDFLVVGTLGSGGFGRVYLAYQSPLLRLKGALKLINVDTDDPEFSRVLLQKFQSEAEVLAHLSHPNIVRLLKYGIHAGRPYLVMEFIDGSRTLRDEIHARTLDGRGFSADEIITITNQLLNGLGAAHQDSIVHRDIKPENIMIQAVVGNPLYVRLLDFGLAKFVEHKSDTRWHLGSPNYMAPEQISRKNLGPWTDLYAVSVMLFEFLSGRRPFPGATEQEVLIKKIKEEFDPLGEVADLNFPQVTRDFLARGLARDPQKRFQDVEALRQAMHPAVEALAGQLGPRGTLLPAQTAHLASRDLLDLKTVRGDADQLASAADARPTSRVTPDDLATRRVSEELHESEPEFENENEREVEDQSEVEPRIENENEIETEIETENEPEIENEIETETETETENEIETEIETETEIEPEIEIETESEPEIETETETETEIETAPKPSQKPTALLVGALILTLAGVALADVYGPGILPAPFSLKAALAKNSPEDALATSSSEEPIAAEVQDLSALPDPDALSIAPLIENASHTVRGALIAAAEGLPSDALAAAPPRHVQQMALGKFHSCILLREGQVRCWGANFDAELGLGHRERIGDDEPASEAGFVDLGERAIAIAAAGDYNASFTCALLESGDLRCWGSNHFGQLGLGRDVRRIGEDELPADIEPITMGGPVKALTVGAMQYATHACALLEDGALKCWGNNRYGQLGLGHTHHLGKAEVPANINPVDVGAEVLDISAGKFHTCAHLEGGELKCWGRNQAGQLGQGHTDNIGDNEHPAAVDPIDVGDEVVAVSAGRSHTCALLPEGRARCWGWNEHGQLGLGHTNNIGDNEPPAEAGDIDAGGSILQIDAGGLHTCALLEGGRVRCWGDNRFGQLGYGHRRSVGTDAPPSQATDVYLGGKAVAIEASNYHTCALLEDDTMRCWGFNDFGQLGYGHTDLIGDDEAPAIAGAVPAYELGSPDSPDAPAASLSSGK